MNSIRPAAPNPVVMIAGPSGSGKSTLAIAVARALRCPCISLDSLYIRGAKSFVDTPAGPVRSYEHPHLYNGARLALQIFNRTSGLVVEGFCLFAYPEIMALPAHRFYLDTPFDLCAARRRTRRPTRPSDRSFALIGEQETVAYVLPQRSLPGVITLDGDRAQDTVLAELLLHLYGGVGSSDDARGVAAKIPEYHDGAPRCDRL